MVRHGGLKIPCRIILACGFDSHPRHMKLDFPYGTVVEAPPDFCPPESWPEYGHEADVAPICNTERLAGRVLRWSLWPLCFEEHIGDEEPDIAAFSRGTLAYNRMVMWRRIARTTKAPGWFAVSKKPSEVDGFTLLSGDVTQGWNKNARRDLALWQKKHLGQTHAIERVPFAEYADAYKKSIIAQRHGASRLHDLERKYVLPVVAAHTGLWGVRDLKTGALVAGTAVISSPTCKASTHFAPFIHEEARAIFAATALTHHWFADAQKNGLTFAVTTNFYFPGKPKSWKGFSEFKSHFGFSYVAYPPLLYRFVRGKIF